MARVGRLRRMSEEDTDLNMVPIMNLFMVLIPFLLMSASFMHIKAINTSIPVHSAAAASEEQKAPEVKVTAVLSLYGDRIELAAVCEALSPETLYRFEETVRKTPDAEGAASSLMAALRKIKSEYPASDTLLLVPDAEILYDEIIHTMDIARNMEEDVLFPNVVLAGSLG